MSMEQFIDKIKELIERSFIGLMNFGIYTSNLLNNLNIKYKDVMNRKEAVIQEIEQSYSKNKNLVWVLKNSIQFWNPPNVGTTLTIGFGPQIGEINLKLEPYWDDIESISKIFEDYLVPEPNFCKYFLLAEQSDPMTDPIIKEIGRLFFEKLELVEKFNKKEVIILFKRAVEAFDNPINPNDLILHSKYHNTIFKEEDIINNNINKIANSIINAKTTLKKLDQKRRKIIADETVTILFKLLEGPLKVILAVMYNFDKIVKKQRLANFSLSLGKYLYYLNLKNLESSEIRNSIGHFINYTGFDSGYKFKFIENAKDLHVVFYLKNKKNKTIYQKKEKEIEFFDLFTLVQLLNAKLNIIKTFIESYLLEYELNMQNTNIKDIKEKNRKILIDYLKKFKTENKKTIYPKKSQ